MNRIKAARIKSKYVLEPHLSNIIDEIPLDIALGNEGLVPSLLGWLDSPQDTALVWQRILPPIGASHIAPLLVCPDDLDFICSVVVAEISAESDVICWSRMGYDDSAGDGLVGTQVRWQPHWGPYCFAREEYETFLATFKASLSADSP